MIKLEKVSKTYQTDKVKTLALKDIVREVNVPIVADGVLVDPFGGQRDLQARVFRHVSDAFLEDPVCDG